MSAQVPAAGAYVPVTREANSGTTDENVKKSPFAREVRQNDFGSQESREPVEEAQQRRTYRVATTALTGIAGVLCIGSFVTAAVAFHRCDTGRHEALAYVLTLILYIVVMVEAVLSFIAFLTCFILLFCAPRRVLISDPRNGGLICLCVTMFILFLFAVYSFVVPLVLIHEEVAMPPALCVIPGVRMIVVLAIFSILVANSKL